MTGGGVGHRQALSSSAGRHDTEEEDPIAVLEKEQETNECASTMQGLTEILEGKRGSLKIDGEEPTKSR